MFKNSLLVVAIVLNTVLLSDVHAMRCYRQAAKNSPVKFTENLPKDAPETLPIEFSNNPNSIETDKIACLPLDNPTIQQDCLEEFPIVDVESMDTEMNLPNFNNYEPNINSYEPNINSYEPKKFLAETPSLKSTSSCSESSNSCSESQFSAIKSHNELKCSFRGRRGTVSPLRKRDTFYATKQKSPFKRQPQRRLKRNSKLSSKSRTSNLR